MKEYGVRKRLNERKKEEKRWMKTELDLLERYEGKTERISRKK